MTDQKLKIDFANPVLIDLDGTLWIADRYRPAPQGVRCCPRDLPLRLGPRPVPLGNGEPGGDYDRRLRRHHGLLREGSQP